MEKVLVIYDGKKGISSEVVSNQILKGLRALGHDCEIHHVDKNIPPALIKDRVVVNTSYQSVHKMFKSIRFGGIPKKGITAVRVNWNIECTPPQKLEYFGYYMQSKYMGVPLISLAHSPHNHSLITGDIKEFFSPSTARMMLPQFRQITFGVDLDMFKPSGGVPDKYNAIVPYNRVNEGQKKISLHHATTLAVRTALLLKGHDLKTNFYYADGFGPQDKKYVDEEGVYNFQLQPDTRKRYLKNCQKSGIFLSTAGMESFGIYYLELLASGVVGVFHDRPWVKKLLPDYKYSVPASDLKACMLHVLKNYDEARDYIINEVRPFIEERYALNRYMKNLSQLIEE